MDANPSLKTELKKFKEWIYSQQEKHIKEKSRKGKEIPKQKA